MHIHAHAFTAIWNDRKSREVWRLELEAESLSSDKRLVSCTEALGAANAAKKRGHFDEVSRLVRHGQVVRAGAYTPERRH